MGKDCKDVFSKRDISIIDMKKHLTEQHLQWSGYEADMTIKHKLTVDGSKVFTGSQADIHHFCALTTFDFFSWETASEPPNPHWPWSWYPWKTWRALARQPRDMRAELLIENAEPKWCSTYRSHTHVSNPFLVSLSKFTLFDFWSCRELNLNMGSAFYTSCSQGSYVIDIKWCGFRYSVIPLRM